MGLIKFNLDKQYFDCIDEDGNCFIIYWAKLKLACINFTYSGLIFSDSEELCIEKSSLKETFSPLIFNLIHFTNPYLKITGKWEIADKPISFVLYTDAQRKKLIWNCHHTKAFASITYNKKTYKGLGYAESISMPIKPWRLPIDESRWGRFLSQNHTVIWISWKGAHPINKIICNGEIYEDAVFEEDKILFHEKKYTLHFHQKSIIRKGKLSKILSRMPWLKVIFNSKILKTFEIKYKSPTTFSKNSLVLEQGWSLFEIVTLKK